MRVVRRGNPWWIVIAIPIFCIWWPIDASLEKSREIKRKIRMRRRQEAGIPNPLPRKRPRVLSCAKKAKDWSTSIGRAGRFGRLPYEIRQMIYTYVLGNNIIRLSHFPNNRKIECFHYTFQWDDKPSSQFTMLHPWGTPTSSNLSLLKTCRFIYVESVQTLYSTNVFSFFDVPYPTYSYFSSTVLAERLACITSIRFTVHACPLDLDKWTDLWNKVALQLVGLREVRVCVLEDEFVPYLETSLDAQWVKPMLAMRGLIVFYLDTPI